MVNKLPEVTECPTTCRQVAYWLSSSVVLG